jgi:5-carboxymethyl-2-hydroxymuconic-semialdehyde dehydrogenase
MLATGASRPRWRLGTRCKPPEWAPLTASLLADITREAGLPDGVFNVVQGLEKRPGAPLAAHRTWPGSASPARGDRPLVAAAAGAQLTPVCSARRQSRR